MIVKLLLKIPPYFQLTTRYGPTTNSLPPPLPLPHDVNNSTSLHFCRPRALCRAPVSAAGRDCLASSSSYIIPPSLSSSRRRQSSHPIFRFSDFPIYHIHHLSLTPTPRYYNYDIKHRNSKFYYPACKASHRAQSTPSKLSTPVRPV